MAIREKKGMDESQRRSTGPAAATLSGAINSSLSITDNRSSTANQRRLMEGIKNSPQSIAQRQLQEQMNANPTVALLPFQRVSAEEGEPLQGRFEAAQPIIKAGLPANLKTGIETLSDTDISDVWAHENSNKPAPVLQRYNLNANSLNIAGEDHGISDLRRRREKTLCENVAGGKYWLEDGFRVRKRKLTDFFSYKKVQRADPTHLSLMHNLAWIMEHVNGCKGVKIDKHPWIATIKIMQINISSASNLVDRLVGEKQSDDEFQCSNETKEILVAMKDALNTCKITMSNITFDMTTEPIKEKIRILKLVIEYLEPIIIKSLPRLNSDTIRKERSEAMGHYGTENREAVGVWKVGNKHVDDLKGGNYDDEYSANLITKDEFKADYKEYYELTSEVEYNMHQDS